MNEEKCRKIYREAFMDEDTSFENSLFSICGETLKTLNDDKKTVSMFFLLPCVLENNSIKQKAFYLYAAATDKSERKKGYMEKLIKSALKDCDLVFLRPANEKLCEYYSKLGFKQITANSSDSSFTLTPTDCYEKLVNITGLNDNGEEFEVMYYSKKQMEINSVEFNHSMN